MYYCVNDDDPVSLALKDVGATRAPASEWVMMGGNGQEEYPLKIYRMPSPRCPNVDDATILRKVVYGQHEWDQMHRAPWVNISRRRKRWPQG